MIGLSPRLKENRNGADAGRTLGRDEPGRGSAVFCKTGGDTVFEVDCDETFGDCSLHGGAAAAEELTVLRTALVSCSMFIADKDSLIMWI